MNDIKLKIQNYKLIKDYDAELPNARLLLVTGKNEIGKTSLIRAIIESMTAKAVTDDPVSLGEKTGSTTFTLPDKNGNQVVIVHEFSLENKQGSFYAIDHLGKKISNVTKIREIIGSFEELPVDKFYNLQQSADGRKKIIENYFYPLLSGSDIERIKVIDKETKKGGETFDKRTSINNGITFYEKQLQACKLTEEETILANEYPSIIKELDALEVKKDSFKDEARKLTDLKFRLDSIEASILSFPTKISLLNEETKDSVDEIESEINELYEKIKKLEDKRELILENSKQHISVLEDQYKDEIKVRDNIKKSIESIGDISELDLINKNIEETKLFRDKALESINKKKNYDLSFNEIQKQYAEQEKLSKEINDMREEKKMLLKNSKLPAGLSIDDDEFSWNGFKFSDSQISKSSAMLVIAEILCNIVEAKIVYIGEKALFDKERFTKLVKMAEKYGKIPVLEQVVDEQTEIKVITEISE
jgi:hypothetical protein